MQRSPSPVSRPDLKAQSQQQKRRRRKRPRNRKKQQAKEKELSDESLQPQQRLNLHDLTSEASALERQLSELQTQLKINYANMPSKEQGRRASMAASQQISATEDEIRYIRKSLQDVYRRILMEDLLYATSHHIEDRLWRFIFYANIEEIRSKLRKLNSDQDHAVRQRLLKALERHIDVSFKFYRDLNSRIKSDHHMDTRTIGIVLFSQNFLAGPSSKASTDERVAMVLQSNYICMGDIARYRASQATPKKNKKAISEHWKVAKDCYQKAVDVYRLTGKPYSQLALVALSSGSVIDVVWYYCMSLAMKYPSSVGRDNLRSFYSKVRFSSQKDAKDQNDESGTKLISRFVEGFLQIHKQAMFEEGESSLSMYNTSSLLSILDLVVAAVASESIGEDVVNISKSTTSTLHVLKNTLTRVVSILIITIWVIGERMKNKGNLSQWSRLQMSQMYLLKFGFKILHHLSRKMQDVCAPKQTDDLPRNLSDIAALMDNTLLPGLSIWCTYLANNMPVIAQYCAGSSSDPRSMRDGERKELVKTIQSFLSCLIGDPMFPDPVDVLPISYPVSEDILLLGMVPLARFHSTIDFFKENNYEGTDEFNVDARRQIRWGRIREFVKGMAESSSFDFIQYNKLEQKYIVMDENAKRQQQNRFMKALATQRLMEQVSSLEKNVNKMNLSAGRAGEANQKPTVYTVVVDVTAFLDGLHKVKKWANKALNSNSRSQSSIIEVVVPLEVIDSLDYHKKGSQHMNMQARESIRYLDQRLRQDKVDNDHSTSFLRTQKVNEQLSEWADAEAYWIGEESRATIVDELLSDGEDKVIGELSDEDENELDSSSISSEDFFKSRRRQYDDEDDEEGESSESESVGASAESEDEDATVTFSQVPKAFVPIISCMLYYLSQRKNEATEDEDKGLDRLVLVTNDEDLAWWTEMFGDPKTGRRLCVKTVDEWEHIVRTMETDSGYASSSKTR